MPSTLQRPLFGMPSSFSTKRTRYVMFSRCDCCDCATELCGISRCERRSRSAMHMIPSCRSSRSDRTRNLSAPTIELVQTVNDWACREAACQASATQCGRPGGACSATRRERGRRRRRKRRGPQTDARGTACEMRRAAAASGAHCVSARCTLPVRSDGNMAGGARARLQARLMPASGLALQMRCTGFGGPSRRRRARWRTAREAVTRQG